MSEGLCVQKVLQDDGNQCMIDIAQIEAVATETENSVIGEIWGVDVVMFEGSGVYTQVGVL